MKEKDSLVHKRIEELVQTLNIEEKAALCSCKDYFHTKSIREYNIPSITIHDLYSEDRKEDTTLCHIKSTYFPSATSLGSTWNKETIYKLGQVLAWNYGGQGVNLILGPNVNMKRSPLGGSNFKSYSEDPYLTGILGTNLIKGIQNEGLGACLREFACNNSEYEKKSMNCEVSERALREIYLVAFERIIKEAKPVAIMTSCNKINGVGVSENRYLLREILRDQWKYEGVTISNWCEVENRVTALKSGLDLVWKNTSEGSDRKLCIASEVDELELSKVDEAVKNNLNMIFNVSKGEKNLNNGDTALDRDDFHDFARVVAEESIVLLKNEDVLPIKIDNINSIGVIGKIAINPRVKGGKNDLNNKNIEIPLDTIKEYVKSTVKVYYSDGYEENDRMNEFLVSESKEVARKSDVLIVFLGTLDSMEPLNEDRKNIKLPQNQIKLLKELFEVNSNIVLVLSNGSSIELKDVEPYTKGLLETFLGGEAMASALSNIIFGKINPSGRLAESFPIRLQDNPSFINYPGDNFNCIYGEGIHIGYRYYDKKELEVMYPFGFGLSYTKFQYKDFKLSKNIMNSKEEIDIEVRITNVGDREGKDVIQVYLSEVSPTVSRPLRELKGFEKIHLYPGESKLVNLKIKGEDFAFYNVDKKAWDVNTGEYVVEVGKSSRDICFKEKIFINSIEYKMNKLDGNDLIKDWLKDKRGKKALENIMQNSMQELISMDNGYYEMLINVPLNRIPFLSRGAVSEEEIQDIIEKIME